MGNKISNRNIAGYPDPTAYSALSAVQKELDMDDCRVQAFIRSIKTIINQSGYDLVARLEIRDRRTGRNYR